MSPIVTIENLSKDHAGEQALKSVSFAVKPGILFGIIGADGAGKTTLMRILTTLLKADSGTVSVLQKDVVKDLGEIRANIGYMPQRFSLYPDLSVIENMKFFASLFNVSGKEQIQLIEQLLAFSRLSEFKNRRASQLSGGMKQKLALACTLIHRPALVFLDEPTTGVDPVSRREFWQITRQIIAQGVTVIASTPYMDEASDCDELLLLHNGKVLDLGTPQALLQNYPYDLYAFEHEHVSLLTHGIDTLPEGIVLIYPMAGALYSAVKKKGLTQQDVAALLSKKLPENGQWSTRSPGIEDLLFYRLSM